MSSSRMEIVTPAGTLADLAEHLGLMRQAQQTWAAQSVVARLRVIRRLRHFIADHAMRFVDTMPAGLQRSEGETLVAEVLPLAEACRFLERQARRILAPQRLGRRHCPAWLTGTHLELHREPYGIVAILGPSNYPLFLPGVQVIQALVAGNAVLLKPGAGGSKVAQLLVRGLLEAGLEHTLVHVLPETLASARLALTAGVNKVLLTGSASTGQAVLETLAPQLIPATLELGGCDAVFVRADANLDLVVAALTFGLRLNGGATCIAPRRVFVPWSCVDQLMARLVTEVQKLPPCRVAPATAIRLQALLQEACAMGALTLAGSCGPDGSVSPLLIANVRPEMALVQEDLFAPVMSIIPVQNDEEALNAAHACPYALGASIFGEPGSLGDLVARVRAGVVVVNDMIVPTADPRLPFGGNRHSGFGRTRGAEGLLDLTVSKAIAVRRGRFYPHLQPGQSEDTALFQTYLLASHGAFWGQRLRAGLTLVKKLLSITRKRKIRLPNF